MASASMVKVGTNCYTLWGGGVGEMIGRHEESRTQSAMSDP